MGETSHSVCTATMRYSTKMRERCALRIELRAEIGTRAGQSYQLLSRAHRPRRLLTGTGADVHRWRFSARSGRQQHDLERPPMAGVSLICAKRALPAALSP